MSSSQFPIDRHKYPRLQAPIFFKSSRFFGSKKPVVDIGLGGMRVFSDEMFRIGQSMDVELFLPSHSTVECRAQVTWIALLPAGSPAKYDVGLQILDVKGDGRKQLMHALDTFTVRESIPVPGAENSP